METLVLIGRIAFSLLFILNGLFHFGKLGAISGYAQSKGVPAPKFFAALTGLMLLAGGLSILFQYQVQIGVWLLVAFLVPAAFVVHRFWSESDPGAQSNEMAHFLKNISLAGAALILLI